jgi:hypothetical protein
MKQKKIETFGLAAIQAVLTNSDIETARKSLAFAVGSSVDVSGTVIKLIKRDNQCKLFITTDNDRLTVFADCASDAQTVTARKIRRGSKVAVCGKLESFGYQSVCLSDCRLQGN